MPKKYMVTTLVTLIGLAAIGCTTIYAVDAPVRNWSQFYLWKVFSGKSHGGQHIRVDDASIYCETFGAGPPVLVLHGGLGYIEDMSFQIRALAGSHFVIAVDSRGHGRSTGANGPLSYSLMSDDMVKVLDALKINRVDVVGWSDGGIIGLDLAMRHPERIRRLVAISANYNPDGLRYTPSVGPVPRVALRYWLLAPNPAQWPDLYRDVITMWRTQPQYTLVDLGRIKAPTLVMAGENDLIKREHTDQLAKAIPGSHESIIAGATHSAPLEKPDIVNSQILDFLDESIH
ncbi:MAG TPA: alpha/beta hydrolase [Silvibacterium sp.]|jgi:pimeloyl-ACP methyl ester carboxylesterase|nr:alpha/beta hydrolase [Silvibacterium sp.]